MKFAPYVLLALLAMPVHAGEEQQEKTAAATSAHGQSQVVEIVGGNYFFKPDRIVVTANLPVELKVRRASGVIPHNFVIDAPQAGVQVDEKIGRTPKTIRITFTAPGEYSFFCNKKSPFGKSHQEKGMEGVIVVTRTAP